MGTPEQMGCVEPVLLVRNQMEHTRPANLVPLGISVLLEWIAQPAQLDTVFSPTAVDAMSALRVTLVSMDYVKSAEVALSLMQITQSVIHVGLGMQG